MSLENTLYYWLCLLLVLLTVFSTGITLYRSLYDVVDNVYHYSNQLLERADTILVDELRELEEFAALSADDLRDHRTTGRPYDEFKVANYHRDGLEFLVLSPQAQAGRTIRYTSHVLDDEIITVTEQLPPASPLARALARQAAVNDAAPRWGKPFHLAHGDWLLPYYLRLSADRLFVLIVPLEVLYSHLNELDFIKEISTFLVLAQQGGETQPAVVGMPPEPAGSGYLSFVDVAEVVHRRPSAWSVLVSGASDIVLYHPDALLADLYLGLSHDIAEVYERLQYHLLQTFLLTLAGVGMFFILIRRVFKSFSRSLGDLQQQLTVTSEEDHLEFKLPENQRYREFAQIAGAINHMFKRLQSDVTDLQQETRKSAALANELAIAGSIQQNLLPDDAGLNRINRERGVDIGALLVPATTVAGDFYYVIPRVDGKLLLAIGDVSGKGIAAALVASDCVNLIEFYGAGLSPEILLEKVNSILYRKFADQSMFVTLFCALLDPESGDLAHSSAGHEPPLLCRAGNNRISRLAVEPGMALGFLADTVYHSQTTRLEQDLAPLEELDRLRAEFLGMVSHELRIPLTSIKGSASTALETSASLNTAEVHQFFWIINEQANHMHGLISDLLDAGSIDAGTLSVLPEPTELAALVDQARNAFLSSGSSHTILIDLPLDLPRVLADRGRIVQVLNNLFNNAARFSLGSSPIRVAAKRDNLHVAVSVSDEGRGIAPEQLPRLFQKYTGLGGEEGRGTGLGLAICKGLVEAHGGRIRAQSDGPGQGTQITFTLPVAEEAGGTPGQSRSPHKSSERPPILVVDDDPQILRFVRDALTQAGYAPQVTGNYHDLSQLIREEKPHLILLDLLLPGTDGIELMENIPEMAGLPVIFISAYGRDETIARALERGAVDYVVKPFSATELTARVRAALRIQTEKERFVLGDLTILYKQREVTVANRTVRLTATEYELLRIISVNAGQVVTYDTLLRQLWAGPASGGPNRVRTFVKQLRRKLGDDPSRSIYIQNVRGVGYRMAEPRSMLPA